PHVALVREAFERWSDGDFKPRLANFHPDVQLVAYISGKSFRGHGGVRRWVNDLDRSFESFRPTVHEIHAVSEERVLVVGRVRLLGRKTRDELEQPSAWLVDFRDGLIIRVEGFLNRVEECRAAAGLPAADR